jgi:hypothetical protein
MAVFDDPMPGQSEMGVRTKFSPTAVGGCHGERKLLET